MAADSPAPQPALRAAARERQVPAPVTGAGVGARTLPQTARSRGPRRRHRSPAGRSSATCTLPPSPAPRRETAGVHLTPGRHRGAVQLFCTAPAAPSVGTHIDCFPLLPSFKCNKGGGPRGFFFKQFLFASLIGGYSLLSGGAARGGARTKNVPGTAQSLSAASGCTAMGEWTILERLLEAAVQQHSTMIGR